MGVRGVSARRKRSLRDGLSDGMGRLRSSGLRQSARPRRPTRATKRRCDERDEWPAPTAVPASRRTRRRELFAGLGRIYAEDPDLPDPRRHARRTVRPRLPASDAALAARVACGDAAALAPLYQRHRGAVYRFALLWSGSAAIAADVTQDVFVHLLTPRRRLRRRRAARCSPGSSASRATSCTGAPAPTPRYVANDEDDFEPPTAIELRTTTRSTRSATSSACAARSRRCRRITATCSCWWSSPSARMPKPPRSAAASSTPCARACSARARSSRAGSTLAPDHASIARG